MLYNVIIKKILTQNEDIMNELLNFYVGYDIVVIISA